MIMRMFLIVYAINPCLLFFSMIGAKCGGNVKKRKARVTFALKNFAEEKRSSNYHQFLANQ
ncbi:hypothetical protein NH00_16375 [Enterobacter cancerogenus]|nr:hypothetical protein NH00_16375 [Enterobacter cancerogenus]